MTAGLFWTVIVLVAMGWFALGWIARGHENRKYGESRLRALAEEAADTSLLVNAERVPPAPAPVMSPAPAVVSPVVQHFHLSASSPAWPPAVVAPAPAALDWSDQ